MAEFMGAIPDYRANTVATTRLAIAARAELLGMAARENIDFDLEERGILHVYRKDSSFRHAMSVNSLLAEGGLERHEVGPDDIRRLEPALAGTYVGGFFTPSDSTGDIHKFTRGLAAACLRRGAHFLNEVSVTRLSQSDASGVTVQWANGQSGG